MSIDDINGTRAKSIYKGVAKDIISAKDIDGTSPNFQKLKPKAYDLMDVSDVNGKKKLYESMRNPLNPVYNYNTLSPTYHSKIENIEKARP
jgi:hypothetical protein